MKEWKRDTGECNENKNNQLIDDKVSDGDNNRDNYNDMTSSNGDTIKNVVLESKMLNNGSDEESLKLVEVNGEEIVVDEIERVYEDVSYTHLDVYKRQALGNESFYVST